MTFAYCTQCKELCYAITDSNGVFTRDKAASNHWNHVNIVFNLAPEQYISPVKWILIKLQAMAKISNIEMQMFKLALELAEDPDVEVWHDNLLQKNQKQ